MIRRESACVGDVAVHMDHAPGRTLVRLRVRMQDAARAASALALPTEPMESSGLDPLALWVSPDQWLLLSESSSAVEVVKRCRNTLGDVLHNATDASDALACFLVEGPGARELLAMGSGIDFDELAYSSGRCVRTRFAKIAVFIHATGDARFELLFDRSAVDYLEGWMRRILENASARRT